MRSPTDKPTRAFIVAPDGRIFATHYAPGVTSRYVDGNGKLRDKAEDEGFRLLASFAKEKPGFLATFTAYCDAAERGETSSKVPDEWIPASILKMRAKAAEPWVWPESPAKRGK